MAYTSARFANGIQLGASSFVAIADDAQLRFLSSVSFTLEAFIKRDSAGLGTRDDIVTKGETGSGMYRFGFDSTDKAYFAACDSLAGSVITVISNSTINDTGLHHVAVTVSRATNPASVAFYIDGVLDNSTTNGSITTGSLNNTSQLRIGATGSGSANFNNGIIDELRIWRDLKKAFNAGLVINEVGFNPASGNQFIELVNKGGVTIDARRWLFQNTSGQKYKVPSGSSHRVDVNDFAVIEPGSGTDTDCYGTSTTCTWYTANGVSGFANLTLGNPDSLSVWDLDPDGNDTEENSADKAGIIDFTAWGDTSPGTAADNAFDAGIWCKTSGTAHAIGVSSGTRSVGLSEDGRNELATCGSTNWAPFTSTTKGASNAGAPTAVTLSAFEAGSGGADVTLLGVGIGAVGVVGAGVVVLRRRKRK
jgi:hypothetical protein